MSDLIKREDVIKVIKGYFCESIDLIEENEKYKGYYSQKIWQVLDDNKELCRRVKEIPPAYDVEVDDGK